MWWPISARCPPARSNRQARYKGTFFDFIALLGTLCALTQVPVTSSLAESAHTGFFPHAIALADINHDGVPDMIVPASAQRQVTVLLSDGHGGILANHPYAVGKGPTWVETADFNGDGQVDLVVSNTGDGCLTLYFGDTASKMLGVVEGVKT